MIETYFISNNFEDNIKYVVSYNINDNKLLITRLNNCDINAPEYNELDMTKPQTTKISYRYADYPLSNRIIEANININNFNSLMCNINKYYNYNQMSQIYLDNYREHYNDIVNNDYVNYEQNIITTTMQHDDQYFQIMTMKHYDERYTGLQRIYLSELKNKFDGFEFKPNNRENVNDYISRFCETFNEKNSC